MENVLIMPIFKASIDFWFEVAYNHHATICVNWGESRTGCMTIEDIKFLLYKGEGMKRSYVTPAASAEVFEANEYVAACLEATVQCVYPGKSSSKYDDGTDTYVDSTGAWHGLCGNNASITFNQDTGTGYEVENGQVQSDRKITMDNVDQFETVGTYYGNWTSTDGSGNYTHYGRIIVTNIDDSKPNHS